jgi:hypothetical protein
MTNMEGVGKASVATGEPLVRKFTPDGVELEMDDTERAASLKAFAKHRAWREEDERRRAIFGNYGELVTFIRGDLRYVTIGQSVFSAEKHVDPIRFFSIFAMHLLGEKWQGGRLVDDPDCNHPIAVWARSAEEHFAAAKPDPDGVVRLLPNAAMIALTRLGYEALIVQNNAEFREEIAARLRKPGEFFGARHELSVGAFLSMAGFSVRYLRQDGDDRTPDIAAAHKNLGIGFTVEAKRKHRDRAKEPAPYQPDGSWKLGMRRPLRSAMTQMSKRPRPWMICIDLDLPCPIPIPGDVQFLDACVNDLNALERQWVGRGGAPELTLLIEMPYHSVDDYDPGLRPQIIPVASPSFAKSKEFAALRGVLLRAQDQFPRMPFSWEELGDGPAGQALREPG